MITRTRIFAVIVLFIILSSFMVVRFLVSQGEFQTIAPQSELTCQPFKSPKGSEDLAADFDNNLVYVSAQNRDLGLKETPQGAIYQINLNSEKIEFSNLTAEFKQKLHPLGIDLIKLSDDKSLLFVINKISTEINHVEIFEISPNALTHVRTIENLPGNLNSIKAVAKNKFYATLDGDQGTIWTAFNGILGLTPSKVGFYDGIGFEDAAVGFQYANGMTSNKEMSQFFVTDSLSRELIILKRNPKTNELVKEGAVYLNAGGDNIKPSFDGTYMLTGHIKNVTTARYLSGSLETAPSALFEAKPPSKGETGYLKTLYVEDGSDISAASSAIKFKDQILVGSIASDRMLKCVKK